MKEEIMRQTAYKISVKNILGSEYIKQDGWLPNFIKIEEKEVSRVNLMGAVVSVMNEGINNKSIIIDDGSGSIEIRSFENKNMEMDIGDIVMIIGRPRKYSEFYYIIPEIIKKIDDKRWMELRKVELRIAENKIRYNEDKNKKERAKVDVQEKSFVRPSDFSEREYDKKQEVKENVGRALSNQERLDDSQIKDFEIKEENLDVEVPKITDFDKIINFIRENDKGDGIGIEEVINNLKGGGLDESKINNLIDNFLEQGDLFELKPGRLKVLE